jgi:uncharacterized membrane protein
LNISFAKKGVEAISILMLLGIWIFTILKYSSLPEHIPMHYDAGGIADGFGNKSNIFNLPFVSLLFYIGITYLNFYVKRLYFKNKSTPKWSYNKYILIVEMIRSLKLTLMLFFGILTLRKIQTLDSGELGVWVLPLSFGVIILPLFYYLIKLIRV